jgi:hypothetical protein
MSLLEMLGFSAALVMFGITMIWLRLWLINRTVSPDKTIQKPMRKAK